MGGKTKVLKRMTDNECKKVEENINLIHHLLKKYTWIKKEDYDDYFQVGTYGLCLAAQKFDESRGFEFSTYAAAVIDGSIKMHYRNYGQGPIRPTRTKFNWNNKPECIYIDGVINENGDCYGYELINAVENKENDIVENLELQRIKGKLSKRENLIIDLSLSCISQAKMGQVLGVSQPEISRLKAKLRKKFEKNGMMQVAR